MRLFIAVDIDEKLKQKILEVQSKLPKHDLKLVEPENLHFTLKFLGEQPDDKISEISSILKNIALKYKHFAIQIENIGTFPSENYVRVIWVGSVGLEKLLLDVHTSLKKFKEEDHKPHPHLTIARVRASSPELKNVLSQLADSEIGQMTVTSFVLKKSTLKRTGPVYEDVKRFDLR